MVRGKLQSVGALALTTLTLTPTPAHAEPWLELRAGPTLIAGRFDFEESRTNPETHLRETARYESGPLAAGADIDAVVGWAVTRELGVGLLGRVELAPYLSSIHVTATTVSAHLLGAVGPALRLRLGPSFQAGLSLEYVATTFAYAVAESDSESPFEPSWFPFEVEDLSGVGAGLSLGCCAEPGFGVAMVGRAARLTGRHTTFVPVSFALLATYSFW